MSDIESMAKAMNMRVGQLIYNAVHASEEVKEFITGYDNGTAVALCLFYLEDEHLIDICKDYCKRRAGK